MKKVLYLGSDPSHFKSEASTVIHCPLIKIVPREPTLPAITSAFADFPDYTHILFTSKHAVSIFFALIEQLGLDIDMLKPKELLAVGTVTGGALANRGFPATRIAQEENQEGMIAMIRPLDLDEAYLFLPRSSLSRPLLAEFLSERGVRYQACEIYDTFSENPHSLPLLEEVDEIIFTSPSTVNAFFKTFSKIPTGKRLGVLGSITQNALMTHLTEEYEVFYV